MRITGLYVALAALLVVALSIRVVLRRISARISLGDGDDKELRKRIRAFSIFYCNSWMRRASPSRRVRL